jgi:hypothetical protein
MVWGHVRWLRFGLYMITKCPHQAARWLLTNEQTRDYFQISMRRSRLISAHNSLGCGFDPGRCTKNASLEKINMLGRMDFSWESWLMQPETRNTRPPVSNLIMWQFEKQNVPPKLFSWPYFGNLLYCSSYPHHSTIPQPNNFIRDCRIRLLGQKRMFTAETSVFDLEVLFYSPLWNCLAVE